MPPTCDYLSKSIAFSFSTLCNWRQWLKVEPGYGQGDHDDDGCDDHDDDGCNIHDVDDNCNDDDDDDKEGWSGDQQQAAVPMK